MFRSITLKYLYDSNAEYGVMELLKGLYFSAGAASRHF